MSQGAFGAFSAWVGRPYSGPGMRYTPLNQAIMLDHPEESTVETVEHLLRVMAERPAVTRESYSEWIRGIAQRSYFGLRAMMRYGLLCIFRPVVQWRDDCCSVPSHDCS